MNNGEGLVQTPQGASFRVIRMHFSKTGRARFISHLDLNRTMTRALRRAGVPIWYTEGFNKHPYVTFTAPLSLGYEGLRECMDLRLLQDIPSDELVKRMNAVMPEGLAVIDAAPAVKKPGDLAAARYRLTFDCPPETLAAFLAQPAVTAEKQNKKKEIKTVDLTPLLAGAEPEENLLELTLPCGSSDTVNPSLISQALAAFAGAEIPCRVCRLALLDGDGNEFL